MNRLAKERKEREADQRFLLAPGRESIQLIINTKSFHAQTNRQTRSFHFLTLFLSSIVKRNELYTKENTVGLQREDVGREDVQEVGLVKLPGRCLPGDGRVTDGMRDEPRECCTPLNLPIRLPNYSGPAWSP